MSGKKIMAALLAAVMLLTSGCALAAKGPTLKGLRAEIEGKSDKEIRTWAAEEFEGAVHADPAEIPYPDTRDAEGYLPAGEEFVHEDPEKGLWAYVSSTLQVEIVKYDMPDVPHIWYEAHVIFKPEKELFQQHVYVNATFEGQQIYPETLAQSSRLVFAVNGDYYPDRVKSKKVIGNIIRRGKVLYSRELKDSTVFPVMDTLALRNDGSLSVYGRSEITADELIAQAGPEDPAFVHDALSFGPYLVRDGVFRLYDGNAADVPEPRCAYGMIEPGHLFFVMAEGKIPKRSDLRGEKGMTLWTLARLMYARGCEQAFNVDGGSTAVMIFMGNKLNRTGKGNSLGDARNQAELFGIGESEKVHTDKINGVKKK